MAVSNKLPIEHKKADIEVHIVNLESIEERVEQAWQSGFLIEVISLRIQIMDYWLRIYFVNKAKPGGKRKREFGRLLEQCKGLGLDESLYNRLRDFSEQWVEAIHGYVLGRTTYQALAPVVEGSQALSAELIIFVLKNAGEPIAALPNTAEEGDQNLDIPARIAALKSMIGP